MIGHVGWYVYAPAAARWLALVAPLQLFQRQRRRALLGFLLGLADGLPQLLAAQRDGDAEGLVVIRSLLPDHRVAGRLLQQCLRALLQPRFEVEPRAQLRVLQLPMEQALDHGAGRREPAV